MTSLAKAIRAAYKAMDLTQFNILFFSSALPVAFLISKGIIGIKIVVLCAVYFLGFSAYFLILFVTSLVRGNGID